MEGFDEEDPGPLRRRDVLIIGLIIGCCLGAALMNLAMHAGWVR